MLLANSQPCLPAIHCFVDFLPTNSDFETFLDKHIHKLQKSSCNLLYSLIFGQEKRWIQQDEGLVKEAIGRGDLKGLALIFSKTTRGRGHRKFSSKETSR